MTLPNQKNVFTKKPNRNALTNFYFLELYQPVLLGCLYIATYH